MIILPKNTIGTGDRFAKQGSAQLRAVEKICADGVDVAPVWNKSNREHSIIGTTPQSTREEADAATKAAGWKKPYFVDADHINLTNVDNFIAASDFFTLDVADYVGKPDSGAADFAKRHAGPDGKDLRIDLPGGLPPIVASAADIESAANKFLGAVREAGKIYRAIEAKKGAGNFVTEVSMDETDIAQSPTELYFILAMIAEEKIPAQTIAPKFSGRFNKGVDYDGDVAGFAKEFLADVAVIQKAIPDFGLPKSLKLSVHSGSDKFSIYPAIREACKKFDAGIHLKTAGTTWVEEMAALASVGGEGLDFVKKIYAEAFAHIDELAGPYAAVIDIRKEALPKPEVVAGWNAEKLCGTLRHDQSNPDYNPNVRQLIHIGFKCAVKTGARYFELLSKYEKEVGAAVTENIYARHLRPLFIG